MDDLLLHSAVRVKLVPQRFILGKTYIFHGATGQGRLAAALELVRTANCTGDTKVPCDSCRQLHNGVHPGLIILEPDGSSIGIDQVRSLHQALALGVGERRTERFVLITDADQLTVEAQNALLKVIEEPPPATTVILIVRQLESLLPTVQSRSQSLYFPPVADQELDTWLNAAGHKAAAAVAIALAGGAPGLALRLATDKTLREQYQALNQAAEQILVGPVFGRLLTIKELPSDAASFSILLDRLIAQARQLARSSSSQALLAVEQLVTQIRGGVSTRPALEVLALSVP